MHVLAYTNFSNCILQCNCWLLTQVLEYERDNCFVGTSEVFPIFVQYFREV